VAAAHRAPKALALLGSLVALAVAGCGSARDDVELVGEPGLEAVATPDFPHATTPVAQLADVRVGSHGPADGRPAFDRIVLEFEKGAEEPSWRVAYVAPPVREDGSGHVVALDGEAFVELRLTPASGADLSGEELRVTYDGPTRIELDGHLATELVRTGDFEATLGWALGLRERAPFAAAFLRDPPRLVVDVVAAG
jgi:hypothetical protein